MLSGGCRQQVVKAKVADYTWDITEVQKELRDYMVLASKIYRKNATRPNEVPV